MPTTVKVAIIAFVVIVLGAGVFVFHMATSGGIALPSFLKIGSSTSFSFSPGGNGPTGPVSAPGSSSGSSGASGTTVGTPNGQVPASLTVDPSTIDASQIPAGYTKAQLSPYFHEVRFGGVSVGTYYYYGTITLNASFANYNATGTIDITGWQIKSKNSGEYVPQAVNVYDPSGLAAASDIRLKNGDAAYLYSSSAPFNLRINKCVGYIAHVANFQPALPSNCPFTNQSQISNFTGACQNYINTLGGCQQPNMASPLIPRTDYACQDYLENNFTYKSCFQQHGGDADFLSNQVWVWTGSNVVDQYHDVVDLFDRSGLLVDQYMY
ncbi:MAG: hypothetical protein P4L67_01880 [Candidatus Pacebacteria bacterium]|nr:hypothetical protein [Candidatus Paceibacterota bacterium]